MRGAEGKRKNTFRKSTLLQEYVFDNHTKDGKSSLDLQTPANPLQIKIIIVIIFKAVTKAHDNVKWEKKKSVCNSTLTSLARVLVRSNRCFLRLDSDSGR